MRKLYTLLLFGIFGAAFSQNPSSGAGYPVFPGCEAQTAELMETCFYQKVEQFVFDNFIVPEGDVQANSVVIVLFEVNSEGAFSVLYVDAPNDALNSESRRVFAQMPKVSPPTFNGNPTYAKYTIRIAIPLQKPGEARIQTSLAPNVVTTKPAELENPEFDAIKYLDFNDPQYQSDLQIPFSHSFYARFEDEMNQLGTNNHTASKPYSFAEVSRYVNLKTEFDELSRGGSTWAGRKLFDENLIEIQGENYWFTLNPILDLQAGKSSGDQVKYTYVNTRGIQFRGGVTKSITFSTSIFESQGRFADYYNALSESLAPSGGGPAIIPGVGIAKRFKTDSYDFPLAEASLNFTPNKFFNVQLGYGRNFIGDGYRSLLQSDGASPYPFLKVNTTFWKIKYTNTYMWLKDVRPEVTEERTYETKYMASHYLSWNVTKRFNLGMFESVVWANTNGRGFDANFINPIIFYRAVEFSSSARSGNALLGLTGKYKLNNKVAFYGQFLVDEFSLNDVKAGDRSWKNKFGYQIGAKYFNAFNVSNLLLQAEYNHVRPYVYAHSDPLTNYAHNNQSLGHQWGGNFREVIAIARYFKGRWFADAKVTFGQRGLDFDTDENDFNYGGNIFKDYEEGRPFDTGVEVGQGNKTNILIADVQAGYLLNPSTNMKLFASVIHRNFDPSQDTVTAFKDSTTWFSLGLRWDIFNWYFDY